MKARIADHPMPKILKDEHGNLLPYIWQEYPKAVKNAYGEEVIVESRAEENNLANQPKVSEETKKEILDQIAAENKEAGSRAAMNPTAMPITSVDQIAKTPIVKRRPIGL